MRPALLIVMLSACLLTGCSRFYPRVKPSSPPPTVIEAAKPTPLPRPPQGKTATALTRPDAEELLASDAEAIAQCNIDKRLLFDAGWPKQFRAKPRKK